MLVSLSVAPFEAMSVLTEAVSYLLSTLAVKSLKPETVWVPPPLYRDKRGPGAVCHKSVVGSSGDVLVDVSGCVGLFFGFVDSDAPG